MPSSKREALIKAADSLKAKTEPQQDFNFRVVVTGKGGVGKTTITAVLAHLFAQENYNVLAVDEDPQMNLPYALGLERETAKNILPLARNLDYIEEKTGARPGTSWGVFLNLTPDISDVVDKFGVKVTENINVLVMGTVVQAATGCLCPENALLDAVLKYISLRKNEVILMDTQAGVEHFGRALAKGFKHCVVLTDPTFNSIEVAKHTAQLAEQIGIENIFLVVNKYRSGKEMDKAKKYLDDAAAIFKRIFYLPFAEEILDTEPSVAEIINSDNLILTKIKELKEALESAN